MVDGVWVQLILIEIVSWVEIIIITPAGLSLDKCWTTQEHKREEHRLGHLGVGVLLDVGGTLDVLEGAPVVAQRLRMRHTLKPFFVKIKWIT